MVKVLGMATTDLYGVLGLSRGALQDEIRRSYRRLAREYHPDANLEDPQAEERFKEVQHAYSILSDPQKRRDYDDGLLGYPGPAPDGMGAPYSDLADLFDFDHPFSARNEPPPPVRGEDLTVRVGLGFKEVLEDVTARVAVPLDETCQACGGTATAAGAACPACRGAGRVRTSRQVTVRIPAGAKDRMKVRVPGRGSAGRNGGPPGDLYVVTQVAKHAVFEGRGDDFHFELPVSFVEAATGAEVEVPKPTGGMVKLKLPSGTHDGRRLRVRGAGPPKARGGGHGDLVAQARVVVPKKLTRREREILDAFAEERNEDVRADLLCRSREP